MITKISCEYIDDTTMITKIFYDYIDDTTNSKTLTHDLSQTTKTKFSHINNYYGFVNRYTGTLNPIMRDTLNTIITITILKRLTQLKYSQ